MISLNVCSGLEHELSVTAVTYFLVNYREEVLRYGQNWDRNGLYKRCQR